MKVIEHFLQAIGLICLAIIILAWWDILTARRRVKSAGSGEIIQSDSEKHLVNVQDIAPFRQFYREFHYP